jgi:nucleoside-diphosphate-sugar epimerase
MNGEKILIVGVTGQVALPLARALAERNEVWGVARFSEPVARTLLEESGVTCEAVDLSQPDLSKLPTDFSYVLNFVFAKTGDWSEDLDIAAGSVGLLMEHSQAAKAFLHCSSSAVYQPSLTCSSFTEEHPLGDNHRVWAAGIPFMETYSIGKIAAEAMARYGARRWDVPTIIARLSVPYGDNGGWPANHLEMMAAGMEIPLHPQRPNVFNPIHDDDIFRTLPGLLAAASVPAVTVNWGGPPCSIEAWCAQIASVTGLDLRFTDTDYTISSLPLDTQRMIELAGPTRTTLQDGISRMVAARRPDLFQANLAAARD